MFAVITLAVAALLQPGRSGVIRQDQSAPALVELSTDPPSKPELVDQTKPGVQPKPIQAEDTPSGESVDSSINAGIDENVVTSDATHGETGETTNKEIKKQSVERSKSWATVPTDGTCEYKLAQLDWNSPSAVNRSSCADFSTAGKDDDKGPQRECANFLLELGNECNGRNVNVDRNSLLGNKEQFLDYPANKATVTGSELSVKVDFQVLSMMWLLGRIRDEGPSNLWAASSSEKFEEVWSKLLPEKCEERMKVMEYQVNPKEQLICSDESVSQMRRSSQCSLECSRFLSALTRGCPDNSAKLLELAPTCAGASIVGSKFDQGDTIRFLASFGWISFLTLAAVVLRNNVAFLRSFGIPTSLIGGCLSFALLQIAPLILSKNAGIWFEQYWHESWEYLAPFAINIVFATVFVGVNMPGVKVIASEGGGMLFFGLTAVFGSYALAFGIAAIMGTHPVAGIAIPVGFAGGHGTAAAVTDSLNQAGWASGKDWCIASATISLLVAVFGGTGLVQLGKSRGWLPADEGNTEEVKKVPKDLLQPDEFTRPMAATIRETSLDSYAFHLVITGNVCALGYLMQRLLVLAHPVFGELPSFAMCLIASLLCQLLLQSTGKVHLVDRATLGSIANVALYYIVFAGVATMDLAGLASGAVPLLVLCGVSIVWYLLMTLVLAPRVFPDFWFERAMFEWGAGVGTTPIGLLCVSMADPQGKCDKVRRAIGYKLMLYEPLINGYLTLCLSAAQWDNGAWIVCGMSGGLFVVCLAGSLMLGRSAKAAYESL